MEIDKNRSYDVAENLRTPKEMAAYLQGCIEEADGDAALIAKAVADAEALRLWEERKRLPIPRAPKDPLFRSAERPLLSLEEALAVGERVPPGPLKIGELKK